MGYQCTTTYLAEPLSGFRTITSFVGMKLECQLLVGRTDLLGGRITGHAQHGVVVDGRISRHLGCSARQVPNHDLYDDPMDMISNR